MVGFVNISFNLDDGRLVKLSNTGFGLICHIQDGARTTTGKVKQLVQSPTPSIELVNMVSFPIPKDKLQEVSLFYNQVKRSEKGAKGFLIFALAIVFIPLFFILSTCSKIEKDAKNAPPPEDSIAGMIGDGKK